MPDEKIKASINEDYLVSVFDDVMENNSQAISNELKQVQQRYSKEEYFASGGLKEITACYDEVTGRLIAKASLIKIDRDSQIEAFLREARIAASLQHPNILPVYDMGLDQEGKPFFTMKLIEGQSLKDLLESRKKGQNVPIERLISIYERVCEALAYAHSKGVIHLDVKPDNIRISDFGETLLCDWGLARIMEDKWEDEKFEEYFNSEFHKEDKTLDGFIKGTPGYLSPEQIIPDSITDQRSDVYSLGIILYEIITGEVPFKGEDLEEVLIKTAEGDMKLPSEIRKDVSKSLEAVCLKALDNDPDERYQSASELLKDIQTYSRGYATKAEEAGFLKVLKHFIKRNKAIVSITVAFLLISFTALTFFISSLRQSEQQAKNAKNIAEEERNKAIEALELVKEEKKISSFYNSKFLQDLLSDAEHSYEMGNFDKSEKYLHFIGSPGNDLLARIRLVQGRLEEAGGIIKKLPLKFQNDLNFALNVFKKLKNEQQQDLQTYLSLVTGIKPENIKAKDILKVESLKIRKMLLVTFLDKLPIDQKALIVEELIREDYGLADKVKIKIDVIDKIKDRIFYYEPK